MKDSDQIKILFLAASPSDQPRLGIDKELRDIDDVLQKAQERKFKLEYRGALRPGDISDAIFRVQPQIVHFSGHGKDTGELCFVNDSGKAQPVPPDAIAGLFKQVADKINCVLLNACHSEAQAKAIAEHIRYVIGMNQTIIDKAAIAFSIGFYKALAANYSIEKAYEFGCVEIQLYNLPEHLKPVIYKKSASVQDLQLVKPSPELSPVPTNLTPGQRRRILQELESLQPQYDILTEKIMRLRRDLAIQAGTAVQFQLEKELERSEAERDQLAQKIEELENRLQ
jgi:hypothetical protein